MKRLRLFSTFFCLGMVMLCFFSSMNTDGAAYAAQTAGPKISVSPKSVNFGSVGIGNTSIVKTIAIRGNGYLTVDSISITGVNATEFNQTNTCSTPSSDGSCTIVATFSPASSVGKKSAAINIFSNDPKHSTVSVKLSGKAAPKIDIVGTWDVKAKMKIKASAQGHSQSITEIVPDQFIFSDDGSFSMTDMDGTWSQNGTSFIVSLDPNSVASYFEETIGAETGFDVSFDVTQMDFTGTMQKNGTIKGSFKLNANFNIEDYDVQGSVSASGAFTGRRLDTFGSSLLKAQEHPQFPRSILNMIGQKLENALTTLK